MFAKYRHVFLTRNPRRAPFVSVPIRLRSYASPCARVIKPQAQDRPP
jgi:hypothetical protein